MRIVVVSLSYTAIMRNNVSINVVSALGTRTVLNTVLINDDFRITLSIVVITKMHLGDFSEDYFKGYSFSFTFF